MATIKQQATIFKLATEIVLEILTFLHNRSDLSALARSCRTFQSIVTPLLYETVDLELELLGGLSQKVINSLLPTEGVPSNLKYTRKFGVLGAIHLDQDTYSIYELEPRCHRTRVQIRAILDKIPVGNLISFCWVSDVTLSREIEADILENQRNITSIRIGQDTLWRDSKDTGTFSLLNLPSLTNIHVNGIDTQEELVNTKHSIQANCSALKHLGIGFGHGLMPLENVDFKLQKGESPGFPQLESLQVVNIDDWSAFASKIGGVLPSLERCPKLNCLRMSADSNMGNSFQFLRLHAIQVKYLHLVLAHPIHEFRSYLAASRGLIEISVEITSASDVDWDLDLDFRSHSDTLKSLYLIEQKHDNTLQALDSPTLPWLSELPNLEELAICIGPSIPLGESSNFPSLKALWLMGARKPAGFESDPVKVNDSIWASCKEAFRSPEIPPNLRTFALDSNWGLGYPHFISSEPALGLAEAPIDVEKLSKREFKMLYGHLRIFNRAKHVSELTINQADRRLHRPLDPKHHLRKYWKNAGSKDTLGYLYWEGKNAWW